jgi:hypothetical protein
MSAVPSEAEMFTKITAMEDFARFDGKIVVYRSCHGFFEKIGVISKDDLQLRVGRVAEEKFTHVLLYPDLKTPCPLIICSVNLSDLDLEIRIATDLEISLAEKILV